MCEELLTIKEAALLVGINPNTIYRYIDKKRISCKSLFIKGKHVKKIKKEDIISIFGLSRQSQRISENLRESQFVTSENLRESQTITPENLRDSLKEIVKETFAEERSQLMKPIQEQALFIAGKLTQENQDLRQKFETILEENRKLQEQIKALPENTEGLQQELQKKDTFIAIMMEETKKALIEKENIINTLTEEKQTIIATLEEDALAIHCTSSPDAYCFSGKSVGSCAF